jgi:hypothetical protein
MRLARILIAALCCAHLVFAPVSSMHAHVTAHEHVTHGGHTHPGLDAGHTEGSEPVVELSKASGVSPAKMPWNWFAAALFIVGILCLRAPALLPLSRRRARRTEPITPPPSIPPPSRGPPLFSI